MPINVFTVILIGILLYQAFVKRGKSYFIFVFQITIFMYVTCNVGYFIKIGDTFLDYYRFLLYYLGILALLCNLKSGVNEKLLYYSVTLFFFVIISYILGIFEEYKIVTQEGGGWDAYLFGQYNEKVVSFGKRQLKSFLDFICTLMIYIYIKRKYTLDIWLNSLYKISKWLKVYILFGLGEAIIVYVLKIYTLMNEITGFIFGVAVSTFTASVERGGGHMLQGLFREPSQYARALFFTLILLFVVRQYKKEQVSLVWFLLCLGLMMLSMSFTSVLLIVTLCSLLIVFECKEHPKIKSIVVVVSVCSMLLLMAFGSYLINSGSYYGIRLQNAILIFYNLMNASDLTKLYSSLVGIVQDGSSIARIGSSYSNLVINFSQSFLFGIGLGNSCSYSYSSNLIADLGILGTLVYMKIFYFWDYRNIYYIVACLIYFIVNMFTCVTQLFGLDVLVLFFLLGYLYGTPLRKNTNIY